MKHQKIDDDARIWVVARGIDGSPQDQFDPQFLSAIGMAHSSREVADIIVTAAGEMEIAENRLW